MNRDDVIKKEFPHAFIGYDVAEVDLFLDEVIREFDRLHNEIDVLSFRLDQLIDEGTQSADGLSLAGSGEAETAVKADAALETNENPKSGADVGANEDSKADAASKTSSDAARRTDGNVKSNTAPGAVDSSEEGGAE